VGGGPANGGAALPFFGVADGWLAVAAGTAAAANWRSPALGDVDERCARGFPAELGLGGAGDVRPMLKVPSVSGRVSLLNPTRCQCYASTDARPGDVEDGGIVGELELVAADAVCGWTESMMTSKVRVLPGST
jgi:hypothetical protein